MIKYLDKQFQKRIDEKLKILNSFRPLPVSLVEKLKQQFEIEMTYNSNGIEGNSLTLKETFLVINEGLTIKGKPLKDHLEAKNHYEALEYLSTLVEKGKRETISEILIRHFNQIIMQENDSDWAGK
jgi:Fic family protein